MRPIASVLCCVCLGAAFAQTARLQQPQDEAADAVDELVLDRTLYGNLSPQQLTDEQANQMIDASIRRLDRVQQKLERAKALVEQGILARNGLTPIREEIERRRQTADLAMSRAKLIHEIAEMARAEAELADGRGLAESHGLMIHYEGDRGLMRPKEEKILIIEFAKKFGKLLPISAEGETSVHRALGFDHRGRIDVALSPDQTEGIWLRKYLETLRIPYYAFRAAVVGKATAPHIHIGPASTRLQASVISNVRSVD